MNVHKKLTNSYRRFLNFLHLCGLVGTPSAFSFALLSRPVAVKQTLCGTSFKIRGRSSDYATLRQVFLDRQYDYPRLNVKTKVIVDLGANIGLSVLFFRQKLPDALIFAFEPEPSNFRLLQKNTQGLTNIYLEQLAVSSSDGQLRMVSKGAASDSHRFAKDGMFDPVQSVCMASLISRLHLEKINILKMDIEGAEFDIFNSDMSWLNFVDQLLVEPHDHINPGCTELIISVAQENGFEVDAYGESLVLTRIHSDEKPLAAGIE